MANNDVELGVVSFNMHGYHQGSPVIMDIISEDKPDILLLQEHWLTPANLYLFDRDFPDYFVVGSSAMSRHVQEGMLSGRPFGGVAILIKNNLRKVVKTVHCDNRYVIVRVASWLFINVYLPCAGSPNRLLTCEDIMNDIWSWCEQLRHCHILLAGDFNAVLDNDADIFSRVICDFANRHSLYRCDNLFPNEKRSTYVNYALKQESQIDYILCSKPDSITNYAVLDPDINFSDHLPLYAKISCTLLSQMTDVNVHDNDHDDPIVKHFRWDHGDLSSYYNYTGDGLHILLTNIDDMLSQYYNTDQVDVNNLCSCIDSIYCHIVSVLQSGANIYISRSAVKKISNTGGMKN